MPRPPLGLGKHGSISIDASDRKYIARCRLRFLDGAVRQVSASGKTERAAKSALRTKIKDLVSVDPTGINQSTPLRRVAEIWQQDKIDEGLASRTIERHGQILNSYVLPALGDVPVSSATTYRLDRFIKELSKAKGAATARLTKSVLSGMMGLAVRYDAIPYNPVASVQTPKVPRAKVRALSPDEYRQLRATMAESQKPVSKERRETRAGNDRSRMGGTNKVGTVLDIMDFLIATGVRSAEALALTWDRVYLNHPTPHVRVDRTVTRVQGAGLEIQERTKTGDVRLLALVEPVVNMLRRRKTLSATGQQLVFPSTKGTPIDPSNMRKIWRDALRGSDFEWVTQRTLRKSVATALNAAMGPSTAAAQLGHSSDAVTRMYYVEPPRAPHDARTALESFFPSR